MAFKALVCVNLAGGNDSYNLIAPKDVAGHAEYLTARGNLAIPIGSLLAVNQISGGDDRDWGFHPECPEFQNLFENEKLAVVANIGTLLEPTTRAEYLEGTALPQHLFSHSDQSELWQSPAAVITSPLGWAGRIADFVGGYTVSIIGETRLLRGANVLPYTMSTDGATALYGLFANHEGNVRRQALMRIRELVDDTYNPFPQYVAQQQRDAVTLEGLVSSALAAAPPLVTTFPGGSLGAQLRMVARVISARNLIPDPNPRFIFFVRQGGYDTHSNQLTQQPVLLAEISEAMGKFQDAMEELGVENDVTTFTTSEFGRTLVSNSNGSDHGWGGHQLVMGGSVLGRRIFGTMPSLVLGGPDDATSNGRMIPTTAVEQMGATLATWYGASDDNLGSIFPRLSQFPSGEREFMS